MTEPSRRSVLKRIAAVSATPLVVSTASGAVDVREGPSGVHAAYGRDTTSILRVGWSGAPSPDAHLEIGDPGESTMVVDAASSPLPGKDATAYVATVTGLSPATSYDYEAVLDGRRSRTFTVTMAPNSTTGFTVTAVGDHGIADPNNPFQRASSDDPRRVFATAKALDPDVQLLPGDIAYANGKPSTWELYFEEFEAFLAGTPFMTVPGNHEAEPGTGLLQYDRRLNDLMPITDRVGTDDLEHEQRWYYFDYDNTRFIGLSTTTDACGDAGRGEEYIPLYDPRCEAGGLTYGQVQERFLRRALATASDDPDLRWTVVYFHGPMWTDSPDHAPREDLRDRWGTLLDKYGVDLVMSGDNHVYERTKPITARKGQDAYGPTGAWEWDSPYGTTFLTNGTGGTSHYGFGNRTPSDYIARRTNDHFGVTQLDVTDEHIRVEYVTHETDRHGDPIVADAFEIRKSKKYTSTGVRVPKQSSQHPRSVADSLVVTGTRSDDGSVFTGGQTNQIDLRIEASHPIEIRDRLPASWDVVGGDATRIHAASDDTKWVDFRGGISKQRSVTYFVEVPESPGETNQYTVGPVQARSPAFGEWMAVPDTANGETVVGVDTSLDHI